MTKPFLPLAGIAIFLILFATTQHSANAILPPPLPQSGANAAFTCASVLTAIQNSIKQCSGMDSESWCAGYPFSLRPGAETTETMRTVPLDLQAEHYGLAILRAQLRNGDTAKLAQPIYLISYGDTTIQRDSLPLDMLNSNSAACQATVSRATYTRADSNVSSASVTYYAAGQKVTATGRNVSGQWVYVDSDTGGGWVTSSTLSFNSGCNSSSLYVINEDRPAQVAALPAFTLETRGQETAGVCRDLPTSGVLLVGPQSRAVEVVVNQARLRISGIAGFSAITNGDLRVSVVQGSTTVTSAGIDVELNEGEESRVPLGKKTGLAAIGAPDKATNIQPSTQPGGEGALYLRTLCSFTKNAGITIPCGIPRLTTGGGPGIQPTTGVAVP